MATHSTPYLPICWQILWTCLQYPQVRTVCVRLRWGCSPSPIGSQLYHRCIGVGMYSMSLWCVILPSTKQHHSEVLLNGKCRPVCRTSPCLLIESWNTIALNPTWFPSCVSKDRRLGCTSACIPPTILLQHFYVFTTVSSGWLSVISRCAVDHQTQSDICRCIYITANKLEVSHWIPLRFYWTRFPTIGWVSTDDIR